MSHDQYEIQKYKDAVWAYVMEHCDVLDSGALFVKFHTDGRKNFEKRIMARYRGYHREDWEKKDHTHREVRLSFEEQKKQKEDDYRERQRIRRQVYDFNTKVSKWRRWYETTQDGPVLSRIMGYIASKTWNRMPSK